MVISIDTLLIKQLRKLLNVILAICIMDLILFWEICHLDIFDRYTFTRFDRYHNTDYVTNLLILTFWIEMKTIFS